jgi:pyruvate/2-oxoglutarate dehydrogenase complex dihydrolipoamide dehydrogenase (E3) component
MSRHAKRSTVDWTTGCAALFAIAAASAAAAESSGPTFKDRTAELGLKLANGAACWADIDNDGWSDLCAAGVCWRNNAGKSFTKIAEGLGEVVAADFDNDGFVDLFSCSSLRLYHNKAGNGFEPFKLPELPKCVSRGACWGDFNGDGFSSFRRATSASSAEKAAGATMSKSVSDQRQTANRAQVLPSDEYNQQLVANVHPPDWVNPTPSGRYNLVVIGAGTAGLVTAAGAAGLGAKVALIEKHLMGGDCLNVGCVPSKALLAAAHVAGVVRDATEFGIHVPEGTSIHFPAVMARMRRLRASISPHDSAARFRELGVDVYLGAARFADSQAVEVGGQTLQFKRAVIATGGRASAPPIPGLDQVAYLTNETVFSLTELPRRFGVIGAGPIGCEMAQAFARFGSAVYVVEAMHGVLPREDRDGAAIIQRSLQRDGVKLLCCGKKTTVSAASDGIRVTLDSHGEHYDIVVDQLLVAVGRAPNVEGLDLEAGGVQYDAKTGVKVNDRLQTTNRRIYAAGDICSRYQFTHAADFMARIVIQNALFAGRKKVSSLTIPWCTYTSPELAHVGLSAAEANERNIPIDTFVQPLSGVDRALLEGESDGFAKVHTQKRSDKIVGATIVARNAGDMISEIMLAMQHGIGLKKIGGTIHPYPTQAEAIRKLGDQYNRTRLTPLAKSLFEKWLAWTR